MSQIRCTYCDHRTTHQEAAEALNLPRRGRYHMNLPLCRNCTNAMRQANISIGQDDGGYYVIPSPEEPIHAS